MLSGRSNYVRTEKGGALSQAEVPLEGLGPPTKPGLDVELRVGRPDDAPRLAAVFVSAWRGAYRGVVAEETLNRLDEDEIAAWLETLVGSSDSTTLVAETDERDLLGFCRFGPDPDDSRFGHIFSLYVSAPSSGRGIGHRLLAGALEDLSRRGLDPVTLWVFEENTPARRFYATFGFCPDGARRVEPEYDAEEIRLRREAKSTA